jgi:hypothetical protein
MPIGPTFHKYCQLAAGTPSWKSVVSEATCTGGFGLLATLQTTILPPSSNNTSTARANRISILPTLIACFGFPDRVAESLGCVSAIVLNRIAEIIFKD